MAKRSGGRGLFLSTKPTNSDPEAFNRTEFGGVGHCFSPIRAFTEIYSNMVCWFLTPLHRLLIARPLTRLY